uniref:NACHT domain-containing protein n=1 Tax=Bionectria ochroleuca TaxID=29856 RepID=A0A8H7NIH4_BIOOC
MTSYEIDYVNSDSDVDAVVIDRDDVSNYNPEQILPQPADVIQKIRTWLQPTSYDIAGGEYRKHLASHVSGTGSWFTSSDTYKQWLEDDQHGLLWIKGIPGSGKSVMAASLIDGLSKASPGSPVIFFFFRQIIEANHQPEALLRDWMDQILNYSPPLQKKLKDYLESNRSIDSISMEDMWKDLYMAFSGLSNRVFCVADALDEMDKGNESFLQTLATLGKWNPQKVKVLITSRPVPMIEGPLRAFQSSCLQIRLQENMVDIDIATFVQFTLSRSTIPQADWKTIMDAVPGRANGLFLYAKLAMDAFLEPGADVKTVLSHLPADLNVLYTDLLKEHSRRSGIADSVQRLILQAVTHSTRPLRLLELAEMIKANNPDGKERDLKATKDLIRAACGPLLEILADETVSVIHHSFTEYLKGTTRPDGSGYPVLKMGPTHAQLAIACLRYLTSGSLKSIVVEEEEYNEDSDGDWYRSRNQVPKDEIQQRLKHPFFEYAAVNWAHHIRRSEAAEQDQADVNVLVRQFLDDERDMKAWLQAKWNASSRGAAQGVTKIHIAAKLGLCSYLKELIQTMEPDVPDATGRTPLWWAAHEGHEEAVYELIKAGANPDQPESVRGLKPLHEAANLNHHAVVRVLLEAGVDPLTPKTQEDPGRRCGNAPVTVGHTPLMYACKNGHLESVDAFLPFLKDIETAHRALAWAAGVAKSKVVARILQHPGIDVNTKIRGDTALYLACGTADVETIRCLLEAGADPRVQSLDSGDEFDSDSIYVPLEEEKQNPNRKNCLHRLCGSGNRGYMNDTRNAEDLQTIFSLLINAGANINYRDPSGRTPLHDAVSSPVLTRLLLQAGADANAIDDSGVAPIHLVQSIDPMVVLIEEGHADINLAQKDGKTPLLNMLSTYHVEATLKFLEYEPDCNAIDRDGNGVLHVALKQWNTGADLLRALLKAGADPNAKNKAGLTPLFSMRRDFKPQLMDVLIEGGADINATDGQGRTVLFNILSDSSGSDGKYERITQVVERGFSINHRDWKGRTLLHEAVLRHDANRLRPSELSQFDFVHGLGLDVHAVDYDGNGLLHELAMRSSNHDSYSGLPLVSLWDRLLELGLDLEQTNHDGLTPLHILCSGNTSSSRFEQGVIMPIDFVISRTKDLDRTDSLGATPLHRAVIRGELYSKKLLDAGADPAKATHEGLTPLHIASRYRQSNVVGLLLDELRKRTPSSDYPVVGVNAALSDKNRNTPLYYACLSGRPETVSLLFDAGADPKQGMVFSACASFEDEDQLWNSACQEDAIFKDQLPLRLKDTRRIPKRGDRYSNAGGPNDDETTRLEEILEMCATHGLEADDFKQLDQRFWHAGYISEAFNKGHDYTAICLTAIRAKNPASQLGNGEKAAPRLG